jgi:hypothetical protein
MYFFVCCWNITAIFEANLEMIHAHNAKQHSWKMGVNQFTDMTREEFRQSGRASGYNHAAAQHFRSLPNTLQTAGPARVELPSSLPTDVDWRNANIISTVKVIIAEN